MSAKISINKTSVSSLSKLDFDNIPFGKVFTDHMYLADYENGEWKDFRIVPVDFMPTHPGNLAWHYGQAIFEGMKATRDADGNALLFRPEQHSIRLNESAHRMCMPELPEDIFLDAVHTLVNLEKNWIPQQEGSALYIRPLMYATDATIGVRPSDTYRFLIFCMPVGPYYPKPVSLLVSREYVRAVKGGVGEAKTAGNYAASLYPALLAKKQGYDQMMWVDAIEHKWVQEVGTMNIFFKINGEIITPATDGAILKGITRKSVIDIFRDHGYTVTERPISIDEVEEAYEKGILEEVFGSGTAAVISEVERIKVDDKIIHLDASKFVASKFAKNTINQLRIRKIEDKFNWLVVAEDRSVPVTA
ncbi:MAG TPA: branched-chain amino acid aminotransferase [Saprospiraceae bacterium]|nr:branched-chain amino acid aminotransferase [Saprospiraceae bacterium]MCB9327802.1 branched-chain amino acid aminotransferase [Lewinellaceae bacterium]HPK10724.1 branched-chain amino acid aminotransferase [Saprospiraceae bacterium]HRX27860.1 branched-chain amino acid aminotransferase [Saprospiraceae bacterium]